MAYNKLIVSGRIIELFEYEKDIDPFRIAASLQTRIRAKELVSTNEVVRNKTRRQDNARRASLVFTRLVYANLRGFENPLLLTFTYTENITDIRRANKDFTVFIQAMRYKFGKGFRHITVPEFQKRGAIHFHSLFWGLPTSVIQRQRDTRVVDNLWGKGFVYMKQSDGHIKLANYLAKYMRKSFLDKRLFGKKAYFSSKNCFRPQIISGFNSNTLLTPFVGVDNFPCIDRYYDTQWLGKGRYRRYELID